MANVLIAVPHPDDETFGKAGTLATHVQDGDNVTLVCATMGQMGRRMGRPFFATRETLPAVREKELNNACREIGITDKRLWYMQDKTLQFHNPEILADRLQQVLLDIQPTIVYSFYPGHGVHPDHDALSHAVVIALKRIPPSSRPILYGSAITKDREKVLGKPNLIQDVTQVLTTKMRALQAHRSQSEDILANLNQKITQHPDDKTHLLAPYTKEYFWEYDFQ